MSFATCNGIAINDGRFSFRLLGAWEGSFSVSTDDALKVTGAVEIVLGETTLRGVATADADRGSKVTVRVVGGAGGLKADVAPRAYIGTTLGTLLVDALAAGKETLSSTSSSAATGAPIQRWTRVSDSVGGTLYRLLRSTPYTWRTLPDGTVWVGEDTWPEVVPDAHVEAEVPTEKRLTLSLESIAVLPGQTYGGRRISSATYTLDERRLRADLSYSDGASALSDELSRFIQRETSHVDLMRSYVAQVVAQNGDGTLELRVLDERVPHPSKVPVRMGIPGVTSFRVAPGTRVLLDHEDGDEQKPAVTAFAEGQALSLHVEAPEVVLGVGAAAQFLALSNLVLVELQKIQATLLSATAAGGGAPVTYGVPYVPASVAAMNVRGS